MSGPADDSHDEPRPAVFVYGTLRPGRVNWPVARQHCTGHEPAVLPGYGLYALAYPVVAPLDEGDDGPADRAGAGVQGDLLWLHPDRAVDALLRLDAFEGVDPRDRERSYYERVRREVVTVDGSRHVAWLYVPGADLRAQLREVHRVPGDDWRR